MGREGLNYLFKVSQWNMKFFNFCFNKMSNGVGNGKNISLPEHQQNTSKHVHCWILFLPNGRNCKPNHNVALRTLNRQVCDVEVQANRCDNWNVIKDARESLSLSGIISKCRFKCSVNFSELNYIPSEIIRKPKG